MEKRRQHRSQGSAAVACKSCRRLKMRCVGADQPPCVRCRKARRECVVSDGARTSPMRDPQPDTHPPSEASEVGGHLHRVNNSQCHSPPPLCTLPRSPRSPALANSHAPSRGSWHVDDRTQDFHPFRLPVTKLPSIYSTSPLQLIAVPGLGSQKSSPVHLTSPSPASQTSPAQAAKSPNGISDIKDRELAHLAEFFVAKMSFILPILRELNCADIPTLLQSQRPLVHCMAFVASRFAPGRSARRSLLIPHVLSVIQMRSGIQKLSEETQWMIMKCLAILYTWASPLGLERISDDDVVNAQLSHTELKSATETTALNISLHRSAEDVMQNLQAGRSVSNCLALHKYLYWLWLYTSAHRYSLLTSTPPTLREDASIKLAPRILESLLEDHFVSRILAEIDLCLLWSQAALHQYGLGEWWSSLISGDIDLMSTLAILEDLDGALDIWCQRWCPTDDSDSYARSGFIAFNYRFTRLCISTYSVRLLRESSTEALPYSTQLEMVMKSIHGAAHFCGFITELPPLAMDYLRYLADTAFLKIVYGCEYVLRSCEILYMHYEDTKKYLRTVRDVAQLMSQIAVDGTHAAKVYGDSILEKVDRIEQSLQENSALYPQGLEPSTESRVQSDPSSSSTAQYDLMKAFTSNATSILPF